MFKQRLFSALNMDLEYPKVEYAAALPQLSVFGQAAERRLDFPNQGRRNVQPVVAGQDPVDLQTADP